MSRSKNNTKIVFISFMAGSGGAQKSNAIIANGLADLGYNVTIISLNKDHLFYELNKNVNYEFIPNANGSKFKILIKRLFDIKKTLSKIKPDIVITFWLQLLMYSVLLSKFLGYKTMYSERGDPTHNEYKGLLGVLRRVFFRITDGFVFQTQYARSFFSDLVQRKSTIIHNPVIIPEDFNYNASMNRKKKIVNVGRLHEQKNQSLLIKAFSEVKDKYKGYTLDIYGEGALRGKLESQIQYLGLEDRVFLKGTTKKIFSEIENSSMFILTSDYEGMPNALIEAMSLGIPCISTDCKPGGARELISNGHNGLLIPRNSVKGLVHAITTIIEDPIKAERLGANAKEIRFTNSKELILIKWDQYIQNILY